MTTHQPQEQQENVNTPDTEGKCCAKCECHAGIPPAKRMSQLHGTPFCGNANCSCHTPDTEWERIVGKFWESEVPVEDEYGGDKAGWLKNSPIAKFMLKTLSSRDTYWKERVIEIVGFIDKEFLATPDCEEYPAEWAINKDRQRIIQALDNLK